MTGARDTSARVSSPRMMAVTPARDAPPDLFDGPLVLRDPGAIADPVLRIIAERTRALAAGMPLPADGATLALGVEGGGMATAMTCGMAWVLATTRRPCSTSFPAGSSIPSGPRSTVRRLPVPRRIAAEWCKPQAFAGSGPAPPSLRKDSQ